MQGIVALIALNIVSCFSNQSLSLVQRTHLQIEALRLAFADARQLIGGKTDPNSIRTLLSREHARRRADLISLDRAAALNKNGEPIASSDTVYLCAADRFGNVCSFINSNYMVRKKREIEMLC